MRAPREYENPLCAEVGGDFWFPDRENNERQMRLDGKFAKSICARCTHKVECAEWGIQKERHGIWGGLADSERRVIRRARNIVLNGEEDVA